MSRRTPSRLDAKKRYLQVALNGDLYGALAIIAALPQNDRILVEAGTPFIKRYGENGIRQLVHAWRSRLGSTGIHPYVVADMKTIDRGETEVAMAADAGASAVIAMGTAPTETLDVFVAACESRGVDAMIDMMNVEFPLTTLRALKKQPRVVILHRGVDETELNRQKMLPLHEIRRIKGNYDLFISVAGGDTIREVQRAIFNDSDIVVIWKSVFQNAKDTGALVEEFLKQVK